MKNRTKQNASCWKKGHKKLKKKLVRKTGTPKEINSHVLKFAKRMSSAIRHTRKSNRRIASVQQTFYIVKQKKSKHKMFRDPARRNESQ